MPRYLIVNADDMGLSPGVTRGIIRAHLEGIVTSASVMINMPSAAEGIAMAQRAAPRLGLGLHWNLTAGTPVCKPEDVPHLVQGVGSFYHRESMIPRLPEIGRSEIERELRAQVQLFRDAMGRLPDHLDSHHHITYSNPEILDLMLDLARELSLPIRRPIAIGREAEFIRDFFPASPVEDSRTVGEARQKTLVLSALQMPDNFAGDFYDQRATLGDLLNMLVDLPEGVSELMCHPAVVDQELREVSSYVEPRSDELAALIAGTTREVIASEGIQLVNYQWFSA